MSGDIREQNLKTEGREESPLWLEQATVRWKGTDLSERQHWLAELAKDHSLSNRERFMLIMKHKAFDFDKIPDEYKRELAQKWGFIDSEK